MEIGKSYGEQVVRTQFNPDDDSVIQHIKERGAEFINYIHDNTNIPYAPGRTLEGSAKNEAVSYIALAVRCAVEAQGYIRYIKDKM